MIINMAEKKYSLAVSDGMDFFANEVSINFNPTQFIFDFKSVTPRVDLRSREAPVISIKHNCVLLDPYHAKNLHKMLGDVIKKYEKNFVKIKKPEAIAKAEKSNSKMTKEAQNKSKVVVPNYLG